MVGGVFNTIGMLPPWLRWLAYANPFFYFSSGLRHAMIGFAEGSLIPGMAITVAVAAALGVWVWRLYATGYGLRE